LLIQLSFELNPRFQCIGLLLTLSLCESAIKSLAPLETTQPTWTAVYWLCYQRLQLLLLFGDYRYVKIL